ncbi:MAG TPA: VRR-NUC domain-containing protein [Oxalicibacterium sp.]
MSAVPHDPLPNPFYYLENFQRVLDWIAVRYDDLLDDEERRFIARFPQLPQASRALLVRMVMRKGECFRAGKLRYAEIGCPDAAAEALVAEGWLQPDPPLDAGQLFALLKKSEIAVVLDLPASAMQATKAVLLEQLREEIATRPLTDWPERIYRVTITPLCERLRLMFFGNLRQDWSEFVLADLGIYRYEQVAFSPSSRGFQRRQDIDDYLHLHRCRERFDAGNDLDEILPDVPVQPFDNPWLETRRNRLLFAFAQQYERCSEWDAALALYRRCTHPGARLRTIRVLERMEAFDDAYALAETAQQAPESEAERQALMRMLPRLRRQLGHPKLPAAKRIAIERLDLALPFPDDDACVEIAAARHLSQDDAPVFYVENALVNSLFGLLCWPAVFAALPGAFFHPFHAGPADLHSHDFPQRRSALFAECLAQLDSGAYRATMLATYRAKYGIASPFVHWEAIDEPLLHLALDCLPAAHLKHCFTRMLDDIRANRSGFPDLIQLWPVEKRYRMIEVKGPGDRLQDNQIRWMDYCIARGMPVAVCHVQWT